MRKLPHITGVTLTTVDGEVLHFQYGKLKRRRGIIFLQVFQDEKHLANEMSDFLQKIGYGKGAIRQDINQLMTMTATTDFNRPVTLTNVAFAGAKTSTRKAAFESYGALCLTCSNAKESASTMANRNGALKKAQNISWLNLAKF
jgi:hypothetical protein